MLSLCLFLFATVCGIAETKVLVTLSGKTVQLISEGKKSRIPPNPTIIVCSNNAVDDIRKLKHVASLLPNEHYNILDSNELSPATDVSFATLVYFGPMVKDESEIPCNNLSRAFLQYVKLDSTLVAEELKISDSNKNPLLCKAAGPQVSINMTSYDWSVQFRKSPKQQCLESFLVIFGFSKICTTEQCRYEETSEALGSMGLQ